MERGCERMNEGAIVRRWRYKRCTQYTLQFKQTPVILSELSCPSILIQGVLTLYQPTMHICVMSSHKPIRIYIGGLILGVNTLYRLFCFFKLFPMVGKGLKQAVYLSLDRGGSRTDSRLPRHRGGRWLQ